MFGDGRISWESVVPNSCATRYTGISFASGLSPISNDGSRALSPLMNRRSPRSRIGIRLRSGPTGRIKPMQRGEIWFAATPGGDRPVLVLTRDPVADRIGSVVVAALTRTVRGVVSELELTPAIDGVPSACAANFDNLHTLPRHVFRRRVAELSEQRMAQACRVLRDATGC